MVRKSRSSFSVIKSYFYQSFYELDILLQITQENGESGDSKQE